LYRSPASAGFFVGVARVVGDQHRAKLGRGVNQGVKSTPVASPGLPLVASPMRRSTPMSNSPCRSVRIPCNPHAAPRRAGGWMHGPWVGGERHWRPNRLVLDVPASAMSSCDGSEQLGCGPPGAATQRRFRLRSRLPARRPPAITSSAWATDLRASRSHSRPSFMSRRASGNALAAPHHRRDGLVFGRPSAKGQAQVALSRRRSRQPQHVL
jgi:hypothetical protein